jgi:hypothetical protein
LLTNSLNQAYPSIFKKTLRHYISLLFFVIALTGCKPAPQNYDELMTHPDELSKAMMHCRMDNFTGNNCQTIQRAASDFSVMVNARAIDPIGFGKKILAAQTAMSNLQIQFQKTPTAANQKRLDTARLQVDILLAVLKATFSDAN